MSFLFFYRFCLILLVFTSISGTPVLADEMSLTVESEEPIQQLEEYVVSDTRLPSRKTNIYTVPTKATVLSVDDIEQSGAKTVQEAIENATGVVMYDAVGNAFEQTIDLRGLNGNPVSTTAVFIDGVRVNDPEFGQINFDLVPFEAVERLEIVPGASSIFGKNAVGGVLNILTKRGTETRQLTGETLWGSFGRERYTVNTSGPIGDVDYYANFSREREDGFRDESDASIWRVFGKLGYQPREGTDLNLSYTYVKDNLEQAGSLPISIAEMRPETNFTPGDFVDREENFVRLTATQELPAGFSFTANGFFRRLQRESFVVSQPFTISGTNSTTRNLVDTESWGSTVQLIHESYPFGQRNLLLFGGEVTWNDFKNNLLSLSDFGPLTIRRKSDEEITGAFIQDTFNLTSDVILVGGFRFDRNKLDFQDRLTPANDGNKVFKRITPRAGITYLFAPQTSVYFSYAQGFRVPTNDELFAQGQFGSNTDLKAVKSDSFEIGLKSKISTWGNVEVAVYQSNIRDEVFFTCILCDFSPEDGQNRNVKKTRRRGFEVTIKLRPNEYIDGLVNYTFTEAQFRSPFNITSTRIIDVGDSFPLVPKNRLSVTGTVHPVKGLSVSLSGLYVSTQFLQSDENNVGERLPGYFVMNARVSYEHQVPGGTLSAFVNVNNLLDSEYFTSGIFAANRITGGGATERFVVPAPGIAVYGGLRYRFESFPY